MLDGIRNSFSQHKLMAIFPLLALAMIIPALMLAISRPQEIRTKAANESCSKQDPCIGYVSLAKDAKNYLFKEESGNIYLLKSLTGIDFKKFIGKKVKTIGNIIKEGKNLVLYVTSMEPYLTPPTPTPPAIIIYDLRLTPTTKTPDGLYKIAISYKTNTATTAILTYAQIDTAIGDSLSDDFSTTFHSFAPASLTEGKYTFTSIARSQEGSARIEGSFIVPTPQQTPIVFPTPRATSIVLPTPTISWYNCIPAYGCSPVTGGRGQYSSYESCLANCR